MPEREYIAQDLVHVRAQFGRMLQALISVLRWMQAERDSCNIDEDTDINDGDGEEGDEDEHVEA